MVKSFKDLIVWQKSMQVAELVYKVVKKLPKEEVYTLGDQMRRAAVSIPSNIAEGYERKSPGEYKHFLAIANGSKAELETQLILSVKIKYLTSDEIDPIIKLLDEIGKIISTIKRKIVTSG